MDSSTNYIANTELIMDENDLNGTKRFVVDGILTADTCKTMLDLAKSFASEGDGYKGNKFPHTNMEIFQGLTLGRTALLVYFGYVDYKFLQMFLSITEYAKLYLTTYFKIHQKLYFTYSHLVCRSALLSKYLLTKKNKMFI